MYYIKGSVFVATDNENILACCNRWFVILFRQQLMARKLNRRIWTRQILLLWTLFQSNILSNNLIIHDIHSRKLKFTFRMVDILLLVFVHWIYLCHLLPKMNAQIWVIQRFTVQIFPFIIIYAVSILAKVPPSAKYENEAQIWYISHFWLQILFWLVTRGV